MSGKTRTILLIAGGVVHVAAILAAVGYAVTRDSGGNGETLPKYPGRIAVVAGCGLKHMFQDGSDLKSLCLTQAYDQVSLSWDGKKLAWDTRSGTSILVSGADGQNAFNALLPTGENVAPSLSPDGSKMAFLHSPQALKAWYAATGVFPADRRFPSSQPFILPTPYIPVNSRRSVG